MGKNSEAKDEKKRKIHIAYKAFGNALAELVYRHGRPQFCVWGFKKHDWDFKDSLEAGNVEYIPYDPTKYVEHKHMFLPSGPVDYGSEEQLGKEIYSLLYRYVDYPDDYRRFDVSYSKFTWVYDLYPALAYRRALSSLWGKGKTTWAIVLGSICYRGFLQGAATTSAPVFRMSDIIRGTQILDENIYTRKTDVGQAIILILNSGYSKRTGLVTRCVGRAFIPTPFLTYSPKLIAARQRFPDSATESRTITHKAYKTTRKDIPIHLTDDFWKESLQLRNKLLMWRFRRYKQPIKWDDEFKALDIEPRLKEVLLPVASNIENREDRAWFKQLAVAMDAQLVEERGFTNEALILEAILDLMIADRHLSMKNISDRILEVDPFEKYIGSPKRVGRWVRETLSLRTMRSYDKETKTNPYTIVLGKDNLSRLWRLFKCYGLSDKAETVTSITSITYEQLKQKDKQIPNFSSSKVNEVIEVIAKWLDEVSLHGREEVNDSLFIDRITKECNGDREQAKGITRDLMKKSVIRYDKHTEMVRANMDKINRILGKDSFDKIFDNFETREVA